MGENEKGSAATVSGVPQSLISLNSIEKSLQIKDFIKRKRTPIKIRIVSKLVSGFGAGEGTCRLLRLRLAYLWLADRRKRQYPAHRSSLKAVRRTVFLRSDPLGFKPRSKINPKRAKEKP